jgi:DNA-binding Xre family transcriptional regulator
LKKNKNITLLTLEKLCNLIDCTPNDIVLFIEE